MAFYMVLGVGMTPNFQRKTRTTKKSKIKDYKHFMFITLSLLFIKKTLFC